MNNKLSVLVILMVLSSVITVNAAQPSGKGSGEQGYGIPNNPIIDFIKNMLHKLSQLSVAITCQSGFTYCYEQNYIYGDAQAIARVYISEPYIESGSLYVNIKSDGTKTYVYRGITSWSQVSCDSNGCNGEYLGGQNSFKYLVASAPSTSQSAPAFVVWDTNSYNGYNAWTWVSGGWFGNFNYDLRPTIIPVTITSTPTGAKLYLQEYINGALLGVAPYNWAVTYAPYTYHVTAKMDGYQNQLKEIYVADVSKHIDVNFVMVPIDSLTPTPTRTPTPIPTTPPTGTPTSTPFDTSGGFDLTALYPIFAVFGIGGSAYLFLFRKKK